LVHIAQFSMCESMHPRHSTFLHPLQSYEEQRRWSQKLLLQDTQENEKEEGKNRRKEKIPSVKVLE